MNILNKIESFFYTLEKNEMNILHSIIALIIILLATEIIWRAL